VRGCCREETENTKIQGRVWWKKQDALRRVLPIIETCCRSCS
jgi:hypothetical protein